MDSIKPLILALSFLTAIPLSVRDADVHAGRSVAFFPLVGLIVGLVLLVVHRGLAAILPSLVADMAVVLALVLLTNGLHVDGLADTADGLGAVGRERSLEIMKDSRVGVFGVVAVFFDLALKFLLIANLPEALKYPALASFPVISRWAMSLSLGLVGSPRGDEGLAGWLSGRTSLLSLVAGTAFTFVFSFLVLGIRASVAIASSSGFAIAYVLYMRARFGGMTGDMHGALNELSEILVLVSLAVKIK